ncbi:hypothetical protein ACWEQ1_12940 [Streptomyces nodosus]
MISLPAADSPRAERPRARQLLGPAGAVESLVQVVEVVEVVEAAPGRER